jgi:hypothetical protein
MILGCPPEEELDLPDQINLVVEDEDYLILDVVINWVSHIRWITISGQANV